MQELDLVLFYRNGKSHIDGRTEGHGRHGVENVDIKLGERFSQKYFRVGLVEKEMLRL